MPIHWLFTCLAKYSSFQLDTHPTPNTSQTAKHWKPVLLYYTGSDLFTLNFVISIWLLLLPSKNKTKHYFIKKKFNQRVEGCSAQSHRHKSNTIVPHIDLCNTIITITSVCTKTIQRPCTYSELVRIIGFWQCQCPKPIISHCISSWTPTRTSSFVQVLNRGQSVCT